MFRSGVVRCDEWKINVCRQECGEFDLCLLGSFLQSCHCCLVVSEVDAGLALEVGEEMFDDGVVNVRSARLCISAGCEDLKDSSPEFHQCNVVCSASEAEDHDLHLLVSLVETVGETGSSRFVDYSVYLEACDFSGIFGCLALVVVEVGGNCDNGFLHWSSEKGLGVPFDLLEDERGYLLGSVLFPVDV